MVLEGGVGVVCGRVADGGFTTIPGRIIMGAGDDGIVVDTEGVCTGAGARFMAVAATESFVVVWETLGAKMGRKDVYPGVAVGSRFAPRQLGH